LIRGVGMGDVKMAAVIGASAGSVAPIAAPCALAITAVVAAIYGAATRRPTLALGPALWLGWAIGVAFAEPFTRWWS
jgi:prepilin signal peptidase PulO-like enzyme (type II secretory pathway)